MIAARAQPVLQEQVERADKRLSLERSLRPLWKRQADAKARAALARASLSIIDGDNGRPLYVLSRWAYCKSSESLEEIEGLLDRLEGKS